MTPIILRTKTPAAFVFSATFVFSALKRNPRYNEVFAPNDIGP